MSEYNPFERAFKNIKYVDLSVLRINDKCMLLKYIIYKIALF